MKINRRDNEKLVLVLLTICMLLPVLSACNADPSGQTDIELWIVTEQTTWDGMNGQAQVLIDSFAETHTGVTVRLDILPTDSQERSVYLQQLRTQILQGGGPDGYLLPTGNTLILAEPAQYTYVDVEPLFVDVELAIRNGLFFAITELYASDDTLEKGGLNPTIMDAGVVDGKRYVLPLRYDIPVVYANSAALLEAGLDVSILEQDIQQIMEAVLAAGDPMLAGGVLHDSFDAFAGFIDYGSGNATLDETVLARYLQTYQQLQALLGEDHLDRARLENDAQLDTLATEDTVLMEKLDLLTYIKCIYGEQDPGSLQEIPDNVFIVGYSPVEEETLDVRTEYYPLYVGSMADALAYAPLAKYEGTQMTVAPVRAIGGDVVATVTYYAALGSGCEHPELTYEFLRQFLLEESQWEYNRPERRHTVTKEGITGNPSNDLQHPGLIENGWPVRARNAVGALWQIRRRQIYGTSLGFFPPAEATVRMRKIGLSELEEERVPLADIAIDQVRFNTTLSDDLANVLAQLNDRTHANVPTPADIEDLAQQLIWSLRWHVSEG